MSQGNNEIQYLCTKSRLIFLSSSSALEAFVMFADLSVVSFGGRKIDFSQFDF